MTQSKLEEDNITILLMFEKEIDNVRGGNYVLPKLKPYQRERIEKIHMNINRINDECGHLECYMDKCVKN